MPKVELTKLTGPQETLLIPLWARAKESRQSHPILLDRQAAALVDRVHYDFSRLARTTNQVGLCARARVFDSIVSRFLADHPRGTVVEIGAGLDTRRDRLDNGTVRWFELDMPSVMEVRRQFFVEDERRTFLSSSVLDFAWCRRLGNVDPTELLFVAEGVFYFLGQEGVEQVLGELCWRFPGARVVFDSESPLYLWWSNLSHPFQRTKMRWSLANPDEIPKWNPQFQVLRSIGFGDSPEYDEILRRFPKYQQIARRLFPKTVQNMFRVNWIQLGEGRTGPEVRKDGGAAKEAGPAERLVGG